MDHERGGASLSPVLPIRCSSSSVNAPSDSAAQPKWPRSQANARFRLRSLRNVCMYCRVLRALAASVVALPTGSSAKKRRRVSIPGGLIRGRSGSLARPSVSASNGVCRTLTEAYNDESTRRPRGAPEGAGPDLRIATRKPQRARKGGTRSGCLRKDDRIVGSGCA